MEALILSCSTGGGHNAAAKAVAEALRQRGCHAILMDPYTLEGKNVADTVGSTYVNLVKSHPELFGLVYKIGRKYSQIQLKIPHKSPVYLAQHKVAGLLKTYLDMARPDIIITTHVFCAEMLTMLHDQGVKLPPILYVATDYTCIPFTQEVRADYYIVGSADIENSFVNMGMNRSQLLPCGIPVQTAFEQPYSRSEACGRLGLDPHLKWVILAGGSMGFGLKDNLEILVPYIQEHPGLGLVVLSGSDQKEMEALRQKYETDRILVWGKTDQMPLLLQAGSVLISKPGGLSTTEACVSRIPLILVNPIPGCETENAKFFMSHGMAMWAQDPKTELLPILTSLLKRPEDMRQAQALLQTGSAAQIASLAEFLASQQ